jgi:hypothetical protein
MIDTSDLQELLVRSRQFSPTLQRELRDQLNRAAQVVQRDARGAAMALHMPGLPPGRRSQHRSTGLRRGLAAGVRIRLRNQGDGVEYTIKATHHMSSATNDSQFRHPIFGGWTTEKWVDQLSQPWFTLATRRALPAAQQAAEAALERAVRKTF